MSVVGRRRIVDMELWVRDAVDLVAPGFIEFEPDSTGSFGFIAVQGDIDWREACGEGRPGVEFFWEGFDDGDPASGRGWATSEPDGCLTWSPLLPPGRPLRLPCDTGQGQAALAARARAP